MGNSDLPAIPWSIATSVKKIEMPATEHSIPTCVVNIDPKRNRRRLFTVSIALSTAGIDHRVRIGTIDYLHKNPIQKYALRQSSARITWSSGKAADLVFTDDAHLVDWRAARGLKSVLISLLGSAPPEQSSFVHKLFLPVFFHPLLMTEDSYAQADRLAENKKRPCHFLFAGNCDPQSYSRKQPAPINNRNELMAEAKRLHPNSVLLPETHDEIDAMLSSNLVQERLVWIDTQKVKIEQNRWLELLAKTRYFLCAPGVVYPYSHNLNEAMACGAVPVLQYSDFYTPKLENEKNCITFSHVDQLQALIPKLASTEDVVWRAQSTLAVEYHKKHLSLDAFHGQLQQFLDDKAEMIMDWQSAGQV